MIRPPTEDARPDLEPEPHYEACEGTRFDGFGAPFAPGIGQFDMLLDTLGVAADEQVSVCYMRPGERFFGGLVDRRKALGMAEAWAHEADVWFGVNTIRDGVQSGRGTARDVRRCVALWADIDLKANGITDLDKVGDVILNIEESVGGADARVLSGHGGHLYWTLDPDDPAWTLDSDEKRKAAQGLYRRFHRLISDVAARHGCKVDNVSDISRVLRVPGTWNRKDPTNPIAVELLECRQDGLRRFTFGEVVEMVKGVPERAEDSEIFREAVVDHGDWKFGSCTTNYVSKMVQGWKTDVPKESRHSWLLAQSTRLACAHRGGRITEADHEKAIEVLETRFLQLISGDRDLTPWTEVEDAIEWGIRRAESKDPEEIDEEVGTADAGAKAGGLTITPFSQIGPPRRIGFLVKDLVPQGLPVLVVGEENAGKSLFEILLAARITTGQGIPELGLPEGLPGEVAMICENDASSMILPRLIAAGADLTRVHRVSLHENGTGMPTFPDHMRGLVEMAPAPSLVIVDPLTVTLPDGDKHATADMYRILRPWEDYAQSQGGQITPLLTTHANRLESRYLRNCYGVSAALRQSFTVTIWVQKNAEGQVIVGIDKTNVCAVPKAYAFCIDTIPVDIEGSLDAIPILMPIGQTTMTAQQWHEREFDLRRSKSQGEAGTCVQWLTRRMEEGPEWKAKLVIDAADAGWSEKQLNTAKKKVLGCTARQAPNGRWYWTADAGERQQPDHPHPDDEEDSGA